MGEVYSIFETIDAWIREVKGLRRISRKRVPVTKITIDTNDGISQHETWKQAFLTDAPVLRDLLFGVSTESNVIDVICTINRFVFFYLIIKWINIEVRTIFDTDHFPFN